jgi:hypothetical protein
MGKPTPEIPYHTIQHIMDKMAVLNIIRNNYGLLVKTDEEVDSTD